MKFVQYSKSYNNITKIKSDFVQENKKYLNYVHKINKIYKKNPKRIKCKNCEKKTLIKFIKSHYINYFLCKTCSHLNGAHQDTKKFTKKIYSDDSGKNYSKTYAKDFNIRVKNIYDPKVKFLKKVIKEKISLLDIGSGAGHFLKALENNKIKAEGLEPNRILCKIGNKKIKKNKLNLSNLDDIYEIVRTQNKFNTISLIGVMEHLEKPNFLIENFLKSKAKYLYISVPLFSLSVFLENSFKKVFPRHLASTHTHLYTKKSLYYFSKKNNLTVIGEWWFGTDMPDLYRSLINTSNHLNKELYLKELNNKFFLILNELQNILDTNQICSEVHMVFKKTK